jgi:hypothetical protein
MTTAVPMYAKMRSTAEISSCHLSHLRVTLPLRLTLSLFCQIIVMVTFSLVFVCMRHVNVVRQDSVLLVLVDPKKVCHCIVYRLKPLST